VVYDVHGAAKANSDEVFKNIRTRGGSGESRYVAENSQAVPNARRHDE
jgi:hypothetical protein